MHNTLCRRGASRAAALSAAEVFLRLALASLIFLSAASLLLAQQDSTVQWKSALQALEQRLAENPASSPSALENWRADADALRSSLASFAASHPDLQVSIPAPLGTTSDANALKTHFDALQAAVDQLIRQTPGNPFNLGVVSVNVIASGVSPKPVADGIDQSQIRDLNITNVAKALDQLNGVSIQHIANNRNEAGILVRGFTTRGQVPFYLDGIPISVPYDGFVDFNRYLTSDIAEVQVTRGYSSPLMGPNALGGAINLVTREPAKLFEGEALIGTSSGDGLLSALHLGSRWHHFFFQGGLDWSQIDYVPLSGDFQVHQYTALPDIIMTDHLNHSGYRDEKFSGRVGWTPKGQDEYVLSYANQKGNKSVPLYQGPNTAAAFRSFWEWPYWDFASYNLHTNTGIGEASSIKFRAFYNQYRNDINMYSNDTYAVMNTTNAEQSMYDEHTDGGSTEFTTHLIPRNTVSGSFFFKDDTHKEHGIYPARAPFPLLLPNLVDEDQQSSIGLQDVIAITERLRVTAGFNADHFNGIQGQSYNTALTGLLPFTCLASPANTSFSGCTGTFGPTILKSRRPTRLRTAAPHFSPLPIAPASPCSRIFIPRANWPASRIPIFSRSTAAIGTPATRKHWERKHSRRSSSSAAISATPSSPSMSPIPASQPGQQPSAPCPKSVTSAAKWQTSAAKCIKASSSRSAPRPSHASRSPEATAF